MQKILLFIIFLLILGILSQVNKSDGCNVIIIHQDGTITTLSSEIHKNIVRFQYKCMDNEYWTMREPFSSTGVVVNEQQLFDNNVAFVRFYSKDYKKDESLMTKIHKVKEELLVKE